MKQEWSNVFNLKRFAAIDAKKKKISTNTACKESHLAVIESLKNITGQKFHLVAEDDVYRTAEFADMWPEILKFAEEDPNYDIIALDPILNKDNCHIQEHTNPHLYNVSKFRNMGFVIYSHKFITNVDLTNYGKYWGLLDMTMTRDPKVKKVTPRKLCIRQLPGASDRLNKYNNSQELNYDLTIKELEHPSHQSITKHINEKLALVSLFTNDYLYSIFIVIVIVLICGVVWWYGDEQYREIFIFSRISDP
jgi:hypothetical protein